MKKKKLKMDLVIVRGNPGVKILNPYPTLQKPLPLTWRVKGKGFEGYRGTRVWLRVNHFKAIDNQ